MFLGIDLGTSSVKILAMDKCGNIIDSASEDYDVSYPKPGWAQQNPEDWWRGTKDGIKELLKRGKVKDSDINGVSFSGQMHGLVLLNEKGEVLMPAIIWCDQRTEKQCDYLNNEIGVEKLLKYTGNKALTGFTLPKLLWVKENKSNIYKNIVHVLLPKDYIVYKLTGKFASDVSDASGTIMFDVKNKRWSSELLNILNINEKVLPEVHESFDVVSNVSVAASKETGLSTETLVIAGAGDQAAGAIGSGTVEEGTLSVSLGTSGVVFSCCNEFTEDKDNILHSFCHANGKWHQMGVMLCAAASLKWWVDNVNVDTKENSFEKLLAEAEKSPCGSNKLLFLPYLMGERVPHSDPNARGAFIGLSITHKRGDMTRSILEGVSFALRDSLEILKSTGCKIKEVRVSGGGAKSDLFRQILSDVFNLDVQIINNSKYGPAYGAAILASVGCGTYNTVSEACHSIIKITGKTEPIRENVEKYNKIYKIYTSLYDTLKGKFKEISETEV